MGTTMYDDGTIEKDRIERFNDPTLEQLAPLKSNTIDDEILEKVRAVLAREIKPEDASPACAEWIAKCYNRPCWQERAIEACDDLLGMCGVEALDIEGAPYFTDGTRMCPPFTYCNAGDPYVVTLLRDHDEGAWIVASWGDVLEEYEAENADELEDDDEPEDEDGVEPDGDEDQGDDGGDIPGTGEDE